MMRSSLMALAALPAFLFGASEAHAARALLAELLARPAAVQGRPAKDPTMSALALEACLRKARELDTTGTAIDYEIAAIDREVAEGIFLQNQINAEFQMLGGYDEKGLADFQHRMIRHEELAKKFKTEFPVYQQNQKAYDAAVAEYGRDCSASFSAGDLGAAKTKLGIE